MARPVGSQTASCSSASRASASSDASRATDELVQSRRRDERTGQAPHAALVDEAPAVERAEHELADEQDVALAGRPDLGRGARLDRVRRARGAGACRPPARSRSSRSMRRTRARCHSDSSPGGTGSGVRTVATRKTRSASTSCATSVADVPSSRWRSSTNSTSGPSLARSRTTGRTAATTATRSRDRRRCPAGSRWASAPSGVSRAPSVAVARDTLRPSRSARARHWSASRVLPTPAGPWITNPCARGSASEREEHLELVVPAHERPLQREHGHRREPYRPTQPTVSEKLSNRCSGQRGSLPLSTRPMKTPMNILDFLDRAETVFGDRIGIVDEPDQPASSWGELTWREVARASAGDGRRSRRARRRLRRAGRDRLPEQRPPLDRPVRRIGLRTRRRPDQLPPQRRRGALHRRALRRVDAPHRPRARRSPR